MGEELRSWISWHSDFRQKCGVLERWDLCNYLLNLELYLYLQLYEETISQRMKDLNLKTEMFRGIVYVFCE